LDYFIKAAQLLEPLAFKFIPASFKEESETYELDPKLRNLCDYDNLETFYEYNYYILTQILYKHSVLTT